MLGFLKKGGGKFRPRNKIRVTPREKKDFEELKKYSHLKPKHWYHFVIKLFNLMLKNYKLMIRSKTSSLIFFFGPLLIIFLVGLGFNTSTLYDINIATYSESYSPLTETLIGNLTDSQYNVDKVSSEQECVDLVKFGEFHVCIVFPKDMVLDNSANNNIVIYVDNSRINLANLITERLSAKVAIRASELSSGMVSQILGAIDNINRENVQSRVYMDALEDNNKKSKTKSLSVASDFSDFDFEYGMLDMGPALSEIEGIRDKYNMSSSVFSDLTSRLNTIKVNYNEVAGKLEEAKNVADSLQSGVTSIATNIDADKPNINSLKLANDKIKESINTIKITNVESIVSPLRTTIKPLSLKRSYLIYTFPTLLVLLIMFVSLLMSTMSIVREKKSMAYFRNFITPTFDGLFMLGQYLSDISIILLQLIIILGVASIFLKGITWQVYLIAGGVLLLLATIFVFIGLILGYLFSTEESATTGALSVSLLFLLFSNTVMPLETLSGFLRKVVMYNPFVIGEGILKRLVVFDSGLSVIYTPIYTLLIWIGVVVLIAIIVRFITKRMNR